MNVRTKQPHSLPLDFNGVGYRTERAGLPLLAIRTAVPAPGAEEILVHAYASSLNPLEHKLAELNFFGRAPPVILGFDVAGVVVALGSQVDGFAIGDEVVALADPTRNGCWASTDTGGYVVVPANLAARKPARVSFESAGTLPVCFLAAYIALFPHVSRGDTVYIPGGAGGVGHLAVQMAANVLGAGQVISTAGSDAGRALAKSSGATHVLDRRSSVLSGAIRALTGGLGPHVVFDATYSETSFEQSAGLVRKGGRWIGLGVGPGKTTRTQQTESPVPVILAEAGADLVLVNVLSYFTDEALRTPEARVILAEGLAAAMEWAADGRVVPHISQRVDGGAENISVGLATLAAGGSSMGKIAVRLLPSTSTDG